jgi:hypothetical protein
MYGKRFFLRVFPPTLTSPSSQLLVGGGISDVGVQVDVRPQSSLGVALSVGSVQLLDLHTVPGQITHILRPIKNATERGDQPLLKGDLQIKPVAATEDIIVSLNALPVQATFSRPLIDRVVKFFDKRSSVLDDLRGAVNDNLAALQESARTQLKYALEKRKVIAINIQVAAPKVYFPASFTDPNTPVVVADLGEIQLTADPEARVRCLLLFALRVVFVVSLFLQAKAIASAPGADPKVSTDFFYDKFVLKVTQVNVFLSRIPVGFATMQDFTLVPRFNLTAELRICNTQSKDLPKIMCVKEDGGFSPPHLSRQHLWPALQGEGLHDQL